MKKILLLVAVLFSGMCFAQSEIINNFKYVIIPDRFDFFKEPNKYNLNTLAKMAFEKQGFTVFMQNDKMPDALALDKCKALFGDVVSDSGVLVTQLSFVLKDCGGKVLYTSEKGRSKEKEFRKAYTAALLQAYNFMNGSLNYHYSGSSLAVVPAVPQTLQDQPATPTVAVPVPANNTNVLFAQPIANGYQLVDTTPKVVLKMYKTSQQDNYTAQGEGKSGVVFKKGNDWFFEYYLNDKLVSEKLNIKF